VCVGRIFVLACEANFGEGRVQVVEVISAHINAFHAEILGCNTLASVYITICPPQDDPQPSLSTFAK